MQKFLTTCIRDNRVVGDSGPIVWLHFLNVCGVRSAAGLPAWRRKPSKLSNTVVAFAKRRPNACLRAIYRRASGAIADRKALCTFIAAPCRSLVSESAEEAPRCAD